MCEIIHLCNKENQTTMEGMKMISNSGLKSRFRQVMVLLIIIVIGIVVSRVLGVQ